MSLEQDIQALTVAVIDLTKAVIGSQSDPEMPPEPEEEAPKPRRRRKTTGNGAEKTPAKKTRARRSTKKEDPKAEVNAALRKVVSAFDRKTARELLMEYGEVEKVSELAEEDYENVLLACQEKLAEDSEEDEEDDL